MKTIKIILLSAVLVLAGCASDIAVQNQHIKDENDRAERIALARISALKELGNGGDGAKVAATIMLGMSMNGTASGSGFIQPVAPKSVMDSVREWASILVPNLMQFGQSYLASRAAMHQADRSMELGIAQSNNATAATVSTNSTFGAMAGTGFGALTSTANAGFNAAGSIAGQIKVPAPNITTTIGGNGVIGAGTYTGPVATTMSGTGVLGGGTYSQQANPVTTTTRTCNGSGAAASGTTNPAGGSGSASC